ncbi:hypothetical protein [Altericista sp. CCNU0014]|uniref:hypothetical protein n=1 Tax=Altericista sp. CCNU0014 TaxID=3082949 RepID=UPI00384C4965
MLQDAYIKSFLEIPVVLGIALCQAKFVSYSYFKEQIQNHPQKSELIKNIRDNIFSSPEDVDFFEFNVKDYHAYVYQLDEKHRILIIVLHENNVVKSFRAKQLQVKLEKDVNLTIQIFKEFSNFDFIPDRFIQCTKEKNQKLDSVKNHSEKKSEDEISIIQILDALNFLSHFVCGYLGPKITSNFWNISRPKNEWLKQFEIKFDSEIIFQGNSEEITKALHVLSIREWTRNFMKQCCKLIRDLPERLEKENINGDYRKIISIYTSEYLSEFSKFSVNSDESLFGDELL